MNAEEHSRDICLLPVASVSDISALFCKSFVCLLISGFLPSCGLSRIVDTLPNESWMTSWCSMSRPKMRWSLLRIWVSGLIQANRARWAVIRQPPSSPPAAHLVQDCSRSLTCYPWIVHNTFSWPILLYCWDRQHKVLSPKTNRAWWCGSGGGGGGVVMILIMVVVLGDDDASRESCLTWQAEPRQGLPAAADLARKFLPTEITAGPMRGNQHVQGQMDMWRNPQGGRKHKGIQKLCNDWNKDINK